MKKNIWLILLIVTLMLLSACQPTPSAPVIVNKKPMIQYVVD